MDWLIEQIEDPDKRVRLFKTMVIISQGMVVLGVLIFIWLFRFQLSNLLVKLSVSAFTTGQSVLMHG